MADISQLAEKAVRDVVNATRDAIVKEAPASVKRSVTSVFAGSGAGVRGEVRARGLSPIIVAGQRPHDIAPRQARAIFWPGAPHPVMVAHHPFVAPNDFVSRGVLASKAAVAKVIEDNSRALADAIAEEIG